MSGPSFAGDAPARCVPYSIPIKATMTECGPGYVGAKYKTTTKACPSGLVTESKEFDTSNCQAVPTGGGGYLTNEARCRLTPGACANLPTVSNCRSGQKWSLVGTGIAHCVDEDPNCPWGTALTHDTVGNPSCVARTCPSNQALQPDGVSCACAAGSGWNGSACVAPSCAAGTATTATAACTWGGTKVLRETTTCPAGAYGPPSVAGSWDESGCSAQPVTCTPTSSTESAACTGGRSGSMFRQVSTTCPGGAYGTPGTSYGAWDESACAATCTPSQSTAATSCGSGFTGTKYVTTYNSCPSGSSTSEDTSGCGCANGATDFPTCTIFAAPTSVTCPPKEMWCEEIRQQSDDPRDIYYQVYVRYYEGQECRLQTGSVTSRSYDQKCPTADEYRQLGWDPDEYANRCSNGATDYPTCTPSAPGANCPAPVTNLVRLDSRNGYDVDCYMSDTTYSGPGCYAIVSWEYFSNTSSAGGVCAGTYNFTDMGGTKIPKQW